MNRSRIIIAAAPLAAAGLALAACAAPPAPERPLAPIAAPSASGQAPTEQGGDLHERVAESLVRLETTYRGAVHAPLQDGSYEMILEAEVMGTCTGFFVSDSGNVATAGHCLEGLSVRDKMRELAVKAMVEADRLTQAQAEAGAQEILSTWQVTGPDGADELARQVSVAQEPDTPNIVLEKPQRAAVVEYREFAKGDVALLKVDVAKSRPLAFAPADPEFGTPILTAGYPAEISELNRTTEGQKASWRTGTVASYQTSVDGVPQIEITADMGKGMSGGPTVDQQGRVVGINSQGTGGFNAITDTTDTRTWFAAQGITSAAAPAADSAPIAQELPLPAAPAQSDTWLRVGIAAMVIGVLGAAALGTLLLVLLRRRTRRTAPAGPAVATPCRACGTFHHPDAYCAAVTARTHR